MFENKGGSGSVKGTTFPCDVSDLCAIQRSQVRGYNNLALSLPEDFLQLRSYQNGFVVLFPRYLSCKFIKTYTSL